MFSPCSLLSQPLLYNSSALSWHRPIALRLFLHKWKSCSIPSDKVYQIIYFFLSQYLFPNFKCVYLTICNLTCIRTTEFYQGVGSSILIFRESVSDQISVYSFCKHQCCCYRPSPVLGNNKWLKPGPWMFHHNRSNRLPEIKHAISS